MIKGQGVYITWYYFRKGKAGGQVAALITMVIAVIFLFVAVTLNISRVAQKKTLTANAVDGAAMKLASYLGSYGHKLSIVHLGGGPGYCKKSWGPLFALLKIAASVILGGPFAPFAIAINTASYLNEVFNLPERLANRLQDQLNKLTRTDMAAGLAEQTVAYVLFNSVEDRSEVIDAYDYDRDGETGDNISRFAKWYNERVEALLDIASARQAKIAGFIAQLDEISGEAADFRRTFIEDARRPLITDCLECGQEGNGNFVTAGENGELVSLLEDLSAEEIEVSFWRSGADPDNEQEFDAVDGLSTDLNAFEIWSDTLSSQSLNALSGELDSWLHQLYTAEETEEDITTWYGKFDGHIQAMDNWRPELYNAYARLEEMILETADPVHKEQLRDLQLRVTAAVKTLDDFQTALSGFNEDTLIFYYNSGQDEAYALSRQALYSWRDSLGWHHLRVDVSGFAMPGLGTSSSSNMFRSKVCVFLTNHTGYVTVKVTRYDESTAAAFSGGKTPLWKFRYVKDAQAEGAGFNPADAEAALARGITSEATAWYTYNQLPRIVSVK